MASVRLFVALVASYCRRSVVVFSAGVVQIHNKRENATNPCVAAPFLPVYKYRVLNKGEILCHVMLS